jgi:hypothetical protein
MPYGHKGRVPRKNGVLDHGYSEEQIIMLILLEGFKGIVY